jgi:phosphohistidine phosphatase SixA
VAAKILRKHHEEGHSTLWLFSHNPFLSGFLEAFAPRVFDVVGKVRKSDLLWLRWREGAEFLKDAPDLKGFLSKPRVVAARSHQRDE